MSQGAPMPDERSLGQVAYEAWAQRYRAYPGHSRDTIMPEPWVFVSPLVRACWEAAARAVVATVPSLEVRR